MDTISPTIFLLQIFGICPITFIKYRIPYSIFCTIIVITFSITRPIMLKFEPEFTDEIIFLKICKLFSFVYENFMYNLTVFIVWKNCIKYNNVTTYVLHFFAKQTNAISIRKICIETNCLAIGYILIFLYACIIGRSEVISSVPLTICHIFLVWYFCSITVGIVYIRYVIVICSKYTNYFIYKFKIVMMDNKRIEKKLFEQVVEDIDNIFWFRQNVMKIFQSQITLYMISAPLQLTIRGFIVCMLERYATNPMKIFFKYFFSYMLPDILVMIIFVNSIDGFGIQVRNFYYYIMYLTLGRSAVSEQNLAYKIMGFHIEK